MTKMNQRGCGIVLVALGTFAVVALAASQYGAGSIHNLTYCVYCLKWEALALLAIVWGGRLIVYPR